jgi:PBP1b-binding outer membrane lipoprotein LpoB
MVFDLHEFVYKYSSMKRIILLLLVVIFLGTAASAQAKKESKTKSEKTSTIPQKMHNVIHPKHKKYSGHKSKHKSSTK